MLVNTYIVKNRGMGFGDFIRGSIATKQVCDEYGIPFSMDFRLHPISIYLENKCPLGLPDPKNIHDIQDIPNFTIRALRSNLKLNVNLKSLQHKNFHIYTNVWPTFKLSRNIIESIKHHLIPTDECEAAIANAISSMAAYKVIHIRAGDLLSFNKKIGDTVEYSLEQIIDSISQIKTIIETSDVPCIILSDSAECKKIISEMYGVYSTPAKPSHLALTNNHKAVLDTLVDYFILSRAKEIHQFSVHRWGSGFSDSVNWLYKVPIKKYKITV